MSFQMPQNSYRIVNTVAFMRLKSHKTNRAGLKWSPFATMEVVVVRHNWLTTFDYRSIPITCETNILIMNTSMLWVPHTY